MKIIQAIMVAVFVFSSCSEPFLDKPQITPAPDQAVNEPSTPVISAKEYEKKCHRREYYFCPGVGGPLHRIEIVKDICKDPPEVISISECQEFLECDPSKFKMGEEECTTDTGLPGVKTI